MADRVEIHCRIGLNESVTNVTGRDAWALLQLMAAGDNGVTPIDCPAPRWSAYIFNLRRLGVDIETIHEAHHGPFAGTHARYVLRSIISVLEPENG